MSKNCLSPIARVKSLSLLFCLFWLGCTHQNGALSLVKNSSLTAEPNHDLKLFLWQLDSLKEAQKAYASQSGPLFKAVKPYVEQAHTILATPDCSVVDKKVPSPGGDKHDYVSVNAYLWPDSSKIDGLPYILRDGERNPKLKQLWPDADCLIGVFERAQILSITWYISREDIFAQRARDIIYRWFLAPETRMNPNMNFAQGHPGKSAGEASGIVEIAQMPQFLEALALLRTSKIWTSQDDKEMSLWLRDMLNWLKTSDFGRLEQAAKGNHATRFDSTIVSMALALGDSELARKQLTEFTIPRIGKQIEPDGRQPRELRRTLALGYSHSNLWSFLELASFAKVFNMDLWNYETADHRSIKQALYFLAPFAAGVKDWPYQQIHPYEPRKAFRLFKFAKRFVADESLDQFIEALPEKTRAKDFASIVL